VSGDIDVATAPGLRSDLEAVITEHPEADLILDCSELTFIDAAGIRVFVDVHRKLDRLGRGFRIRDLQSSYLRIFDLLDLTDSLDIRPRREGGFVPERPWVGHGGHLPRRHDMADPTRPDQATRAEEARDAERPAGPDRGPTPDEEAIADDLDIDPATAEHYEEMAERGANQQGEGRIP
jgi:anti-anti-sigma factor